MAENVSRETAADLKLAILTHLYEALGSRDIAVVYLDVSDAVAEAEFYFPQFGQYQVYRVERRAGGDIDAYSAGYSLGQMAVFHFEEVAGQPVPRGATNAQRETAYPV